MMLTVSPAAAESWPIDLVVRSMRGTAALPVRLVDGETDWPAWITALATVVLAVGICFAYQQLKDAGLARHVQIINDFGQRWDGDRLWEARALKHKYDNVSLAEEAATYIWAPRCAPDIPLLLRVPNYFEDLAMMVELGRLDTFYVERAFGLLARREWAFWELAILVMRTDAPDSYTEFQKLVDELPGPARG
jgi:hypothetical protein